MMTSHLKNKSLGLYKDILEVYELRYALLRPNL